MTYIKSPYISECKICLLYFFIKISMYSVSYAKQCFESQLEYYESIKRVQLQMRFLKGITGIKSVIWHQRIAGSLVLPLKTFLNVHLHVTSLCREQSTGKQDVRPYVSDTEHLSFLLCLGIS